MKFRPTTGDTVWRDLREFAKYIVAINHDIPDSGRAELASWLNKKLDELLGYDFFGTEGQCDPRGDHRDVD